MILKYTMRTSCKHLPQPSDDIYLADTIGELGLFYNLSPIVCVGRSFSKDGGGGHNPIEAAHFDCAILHGPKVQNLQTIYNDFKDAGATVLAKDESDLKKRVETLLTSPERVTFLTKQCFKLYSEEIRSFKHHIYTYISPSFW